MSDEFIIDVKKVKVVAKVKMEDGTQYEIYSPNMVELELLQESQKSKDPNDFFKALEKLGLPVAASKKLPLEAMKQIGKRIIGDTEVKK